MKPRSSNSGSRAKPMAPVAPVRRTRVFISASTKSRRILSRIADPKGTLLIHVRGPVFILTNEAGVSSALAEKMNFGQSGVTPIVNEVFDARMVNRLRGLHA